VSLLTPLRRMRPGLVARTRTRTLNAAPADITILPDPTITPAERAWATVAYLEAHPGEWDQHNYGEFKRDGSTIGCFAHHLVKNAGYTTFGCRGDAKGGGCEQGHPQCRDASYVKTENGWGFMSDAADRLLGLTDQSNGGLYAGGNTFADIKEIVTFTLGPAPR
jgi:hypothetical protein